MAFGNAVIIKPSDYTPSSVGLLAEVVGKVGGPEGVLGVVPGLAETGQAVAEAKVDKVCMPSISMKAIPLSGL